MPWMASGYVIQIKKVKASQVRTWSKDSYHDTWEDAHRALLGRVVKEQEENEKERRRLVAARKRVEAMTPPAEPPNE